MEPGDRDFLREVGQRIEGDFPGMRQRIEGLAQEQIGRPITVTNWDNHTKTYTAPSLTGYILPVASDNMEHVVLFTNGDVIVTKPQTATNPENQTNLTERYVSDMRPSEDNYRLSIPDSDFSIVNRFLKSTITMNITLQNTNLDKNAEIIEKLKTALNLAREIKKQREQAKQDGLQTMFAEIDNFLKPNTPKFDLPPDIAGSEDFNS